AFAHIGFSCAVTLLVLNVIKPEYATVIAAGLAVLLAASLLIEKYRRAVAVPLCVGSALFACLIFITVYQSAVLPAMSLNGVSADTEFYIIDLAKRSSNGWEYTVKTSAIFFDGAPQTIKLRLFSKDVITADAYQSVSARLSFESISSKAFNSYGSWSKGIYLVATLEDYTVSEDMFNAPLRAILHLRHDIIQTLLTSVQGDEGALSAAVLIGDKASLSERVYNAFTFAGASHLMAVSGLHITVITTFIYYVLKFFRINSRISSAVCCVFTGVYILLAGSTGSVRRAGIMMLVLLFGDIIGRKADTLNSLGFAVFLMCFNPFCVSDVGAVLSVLAVLSLITLYPVLYEPTVEGNINYFKRSVIISFCVCVFTMPAMFLFFGYVSFNSLISNIVMVPLGAASTVMSLFTYIFCKIGLFGGFIAMLDRLFNKLLIYICTLISNITALNFSMNKYFGIVIAAALMIIALCYIMHNKKLLKTAGIISSVFVIASIISFSLMSANNAEVFITRGDASVIKYKNRTVVYNVNDNLDYNDVKNYLKRERADIDLLIDCDGGNAYTYKLCNAFSVEKVISNKYTDYLEYLNTNEVVISSNYKNDLFKDFTIEYFVNEDYNYFNALVKNKTVTVSDYGNIKADIKVTKRYALDRNGKINLNKGSVLYEIGDNTIEARRLGLWQE
ncbi:MAG: ComEC/Rec2 family competence protein, partial [Eubacterium sp.]|nr:ComEC/Rec2 family competence protein [Eubacterium sp.]